MADNEARKASQSSLLTDPVNKLHVPNTRPNVALAFNYILDAMDGRFGMAAEALRLFWSNCISASG